MIKKCAECGKEFETRNPQALYCNDQHYRPCPICGTPVAVAKHRLNESPKCCSGKCKHELRKRNMPKKTCIFCGKEFTPTSGVNLVCEDTHYAKCEICGKEFIRTINNYHDGITTCSRECTLKKMKKNYIGKYGVEHPMQNAKVQERHKAAMKEKYGVEHALQSADLKAKAVQTNQERFGADWALGSETIHNRAEKTKLDKYGKTSYLATDECKEKSQATCLEKYGVENPMQSEEIRQKAKQTMLERYEVANSIYIPGVVDKIQAVRAEKHDEIVAKTKATCLERYGVDNPSRVPEFTDKIRQTMLERYGVECASQYPEFRSKAVSTNMLRYGVPYYVMTEECRNLTNTISQVNKSFAKRLDAAGIVSTFEYSIGMKSYDLYLPERNLLIEIDPTYTHTSAGNHWDKEGMNRFYHINKTKLAEKQGLKCMHIFDWDNWDKIIDILRGSDILYARNTEVRELDAHTVEKFLNMYHLQNSCRGQDIRLGLFYQDELVEVMTFGKSRFDKAFDAELLRLCTCSKYKVIGGASKLYKYAITHYPLGRIISYCDTAKFSGAVYEQLGMKLIRETEPQEIWAKGTKKITANLLRQRGYDQLFGTHYGKGTSNEELMLENHWLPIYDCGQKVFASR